MGKTFSPKQVARSLDVSESTLKRWCDRGKIRTLRTAGGHRRIALADLLQFVRGSDCPLVHPELLDLPALSPHQQQGLDVARGYFLTALIAGHEKTCQQIVTELLYAGHSIAALCDELLAEAMHEMGRLWSCGSVDVYQERMACDICTNLLHEFEKYLPDRGLECPLAIGGAPESDPYALPTRMVALALREVGWRAISLGNSLPLATICSATERMRPALVWLSLSSPADDPTFCESIRDFEGRLPSDVRLLVGGRALRDAIGVRRNIWANCRDLRQLQMLAGPLAEELRRPVENTIGA